MDLKTALMKQGNSLSETKDIISTMIEDVLSGSDPEDVLYEYGLEPDYVIDLINMVI